MTRLLPPLLLAHIASSAFAISLPPLTRFVSASYYSQSQQPLRSSLDLWIEKEEQVALDKLLANVKPFGRNVEDKGVADGTIIASPSTNEPNYYYQWVRDAAISTNTLVDIFAKSPFSKLSPSLTAILSAYATLQSKLQRTTNPSGSFDDLSSLGEPKFRVDGTPFTEAWGRPQRDGPALRAITLISYLRAYNSSHPSLWNTRDGDDFYDLFYTAEMPARSVIKADLEYVSHNWDQTSFDLWEEVEGMHFFTAMVQLRALREGAQIARAFGDTAAADWYAKQAQQMKKYVKRFWNKNKGHIVETLWSRRSGLDCGVLLGSLHALPSEDVGGDGQAIFPPWADEVLVTLLRLVEDQSSRFPINSKSDGPTDEEDNDEDASFTTWVMEGQLEGTGLGRYPEDIYDGYANSPNGGNPWFLCTSSAAEILYRTASHFSTSSNFTITSRGLPFYSALLATSSLAPEADVMYGPGHVMLHTIVERLKLVGDEFMEVVKTHVDADGGMSEQFDGVTGFMRGAGDLSWSYGAFLSAAGARKALHL
ncbi:glucan-alpha-1,4-glucosidase-like protein [Byssothecium circinans]|uniref:glucan 1,4-alpha-glucosidase n=1 Tax=Byssothecium circinans TaxID=147558 RepID=A0A6A5TBP0_9PLEO|nr:glucan-alpha-1,4-glucosidase-like protein [Byssothecium circinans]